MMKTTRVSNIWSERVEGGGKRGAVPGSAISGAASCLTQPTPHPLRMTPPNEETRDGNNLIHFTYMTGL